MKNKKRILVKTYSGMPPGAGIYDDGRFYNCAPGALPQVIQTEFEECFYDDPVSGKFTFDKQHPEYKASKAGLLMAGIDIDAITSKDEYEEVISVSRYGYYIYDNLIQKMLSSKPENIQEKIQQALRRNDWQEYERLSTIIERKKTLRLTVYTNNRAPKNSVT